MPLLPNLRNQRIQPVTDILGSLTPLTPIPPDIPVVAQAPRLAVGANLSRDPALVVAVVPFADRVCDLDVGVCADVEGGGGGRGGRFVVVPWVAVAAA